MGLDIVILAAGKGTRMHSDLPKVLHQLAGKPILTHIIDTVADLKPEQIHIVVGYGRQQIEQHYQAETCLNFIEQSEQLGTGHAVLTALPHLNPENTALILVGDAPLVSLIDLQSLVEQADQQMLVLTADVEDATGLGRVVRDGDDLLQKIVEHKDATPSQLAISEINSGIIALPVQWLSASLNDVKSDNAQGEYYLPDIIPLLQQQNKKIKAYKAKEAWQILGINSKSQLAAMEAHYRSSRADALLNEGVTVIDPSRIDIRGDLQVGRGATIDIDVILAGSNTIGSRVSIGAFCHITNCQIGDDVVIQPYCHLENAVIHKGAQVGPYARLRTGTVLEENTKVGNFVETKKTRLGKGSKASHLTYLGDANIGTDVNIGAGTITCNYDGVNKFITTIEDDVFVGSNSALVAPVTIAEGTTVGAGSTISKSTEKSDLAIARAKQKNIKGWQRPKKK